eukprot:UN02726
MLVFHLIIIKRRFQDAQIDHSQQQAIAKSEQHAEVITNGLARFYRDIMLPLEQQYKFPAFASPSWNQIDFFTPPSVLLIGGYSTGKTSFIQYLTERTIQGSRISNEPTTSSFSAVMGITKIIQLNV